MQGAENIVNEKVIECMKNMKSLIIYITMVLSSYILVKFYKKKFTKRVSSKQQVTSVTKIKSFVIVIKY